MQLMFQNLEWKKNESNVALGGIIFQENYLVGFDVLDHTLHFWNNIVDMVNLKKYFSTSSVLCIDIQIFLLLSIYYHLSYQFPPFLPSFFSFLISYFLSLHCRCLFRSGCANTTEFMKCTCFASFTMSLNSKFLKFNDVFKCFNTSQSAKHLHKGST